MAWFNRFKEKRNTSTETLHSREGTKYGRLAREGRQRHCISRNGKKQEWLCFGEDLETANERTHRGKLISELKERRSPKGKRGRRQVADARQ